MGLPHSKVGLRVQLLPRCGVENANPIVEASSCDEFVVGAEGNADHGIFMRNRQLIVNVQLLLHFVVQYNTPIIARAHCKKNMAKDV